MTKNLFFIAVATIIIFAASSCQPTNEVTYPENLMGFWTSEYSDTDKWYGLDVQKESTSLITYQSDEVLEEQVFTLQYDSKTGKGSLNGDFVLQLQVSADSVITIQMASGDIKFKPSTRPKKVASMTGFWESNKIDDWRMNLIVFPKNANGETPITLIELDESFNEYTGTMGTLDYFNPETGEASISSNIYSGKLNVNINKEPLTLTFAEGLDEDWTLTKQPKAQNMPESLVGTWNSSTYAPLLSLSINVVDEKTCSIDYQLINPKTQQTEKGKVYGDIYYCKYAGVGAVIPQDLKEHPELAEYIGMNACGIFNVISKTTVKVSFMSYTFEFTKQ